VVNEFPSRIYEGSGSERVARYMPITMANAAAAKVQFGA